MRGEAGGQLGQTISLSQAGVQTLVDMPRTVTAVENIKVRLACYHPSAEVWGMGKGISQASEGALQHRGGRIQEMFRG